MTTLNREWLIDPLDWKAYELGTAHICDDPNAIHVIRKSILDDMLLFSDDMIEHDADTRSTFLKIIELQSNRIKELSKELNLLKAQT